MAVGCYVPLYLTFSFKGVPATECVDDEYEGGRRGAEGEFPFGERTAYVDLGRKIRRFRIKLAFRENSHLADALAFFHACESPGPGNLIHPSYGSVRAACKSIKVHNSKENSQGETTADVEFVEANSQFSGAALVGSLAGLNVAPLIAATAISFADGFRAATAPFYAARPMSMLAANMIGSVREQLLLTGGISQDATYWQVAHDLSAIADTTAPLTTEAAWLGLAGGYAAIDKYGATPERKVEAFRSLANTAIGLSAPTADPDTASSLEAIVMASRILSAGYMTRSAMALGAQNMQDGFALYDRIVKTLDAEQRVARDVCNNALHLALVDFTAEAQAAVLNRIYDLPPIVEYEFHRPVFSIVAAYEIYGDARKFGLIESHNARHLPFAIGPSVIAPRPTD